MSELKATDCGEARQLADELIRWAGRLHIALPQSLYDRARRLTGELPGAAAVSGEHATISAATSAPCWWEVLLVIPVIVLVSAGLVIGLIIAPIWSGFKLGMGIFNEWGLAPKDAGRGN